MPDFFQEYLSILEGCHNDIWRQIGDLTFDGLDWIPSPDMNSITVLVYHLTGAERYWIGDVVDQTPSGRDRNGEFRVKNMGADALKTRLDENMEYIRKAVGKLSLTDLAATRVSPRDGRTFTVAWALLHALEHSMLHLGHIEMTRQLWESRKSSS
ncbi:MAG: DinB family protein [Chloroflexota bacterium]